MADGDKVLICRQCGREFRFSRTEQEFFTQRGFSEPVRCPDCRRRRRADTLRLQCAQCGTELDGTQPTYCGQCLDNTKLELEFKLGQLRKQCDVLEKRLSTPEAKQQEADINALKKELEEMRLRNSELQTHLEAAQARELELTKAVGERERRMGEFTTELDDVRKKAGELQHDLEEARVGLERATPAARNETLRLLGERVTVLETRVSEIVAPKGGNKPTPGASAGTSAAWYHRGLIGKLRRWFGSVERQY